METLPGELTGRENRDPGNRSEAVALALQEGEATAHWVVDTHKPAATLQGWSVVSEPFPSSHSHAQVCGHLITVCPGELRESMVAMAQHIWADTGKLSYTHASVRLCVCNHMHLIVCMWLYAFDCVWLSVCPRPAQWKPSPAICPSCWSLSGTVPPVFRRKDKLNTQGVGSQFPKNWVTWT